MAYTVMVYVKGIGTAYADAINLQHADSNADDSSIIGRTWTDSSKQKNGYRW